MRPLDRSRSPALLAPLIDLLLIGGLSFVAYGLLAAFHPGDRSVEIYTAAAWLSWVCNWPHFAATNVRLYRSRAEIRQFPLTAFVTPFAMVGTVAACFAFPTTLAPAFIKLYAIWSPYHFCGQALGISLLYARRAGITVAPWQRLALSTAIFGTFLTSTAASEAGSGGEYYGIRHAALGIPAWTPGAFRWLMFAGAIGVAFWAIRWSLRERRAFPILVLLPGATMYLWFVHGARMPAFNEFVPFFHSLQYLFVAWTMRLNDGRRESAAAGRPWHPARDLTGWAVAIFALGAVLFHFLPRWTATATGADVAFTTGIVLAAVQVHHFFVDGVIWKLRAPQVSASLVRAEPSVGAPATSGAPA
jgi:hypothetical protein